MKMLTEVKIRILVRVALWLMAMTRLTIRLNKRVMARVAEEAKKAEGE